MKIDRIPAKSEIENELKKSQTEIQQLLNKLQSIQKSESISIMTAGLAHDFNNLLVGININANLSLLELPKDSPITEYLQSIISIAADASNICKQLLVYSGKTQLTPEPLDISKSVQDICNLIKVSTPTNIELNYHLGENLPLIIGEKTQIHQIIMNLISNAADAIGNNNGTITIETETEYCNNNKNNIFVCLKITDTGCGMNKETKDMIFNPFFSTKISGRGLGLAVVKEIVCNFKGTIEVDSIINQGTSFKILFPVFNQ